MAQNNNKKKKQVKRWSQQEDETLMRYIKEYPYNMSKAFKACALEVQRNQKAVSQHWYGTLSKKSKHVLFLTVSGKHKCINHKLGKGVPMKQSVFRRILSLLGLSI